jgi:hypothetical protein
MSNSLYKKLFDLEMKLLQPDVRHSSKKISEILDENFIEFCRSGHIWRYKVGDVIESQNDDLSRYEIVDFKIKILSENVFLVTYQSNRLEESNNISYSLRSSIWKEVDGKLKMIFHQGTPIR